MEVVEGLNNRYVRMLIRENRREGMEGYRSRIVQKNKITHLLRIDKRYIDGAEYFYFDITGLKSMRQLVSEEAMTVEKMNAFIDALEETLQKVEEYLLLQAELCLQPEYVLYDEKHEKWRFMYVPDYEGQQAVDIGELVEVIMDRVDCENEDDLERFYHFYNEVLKSPESMSLSALVRIWDKGGVKFEVPKKELKSVAVISESTTEIDDMRTEEVKPMYKGRIYRVPYHGIKVKAGTEGKLT